VTQRRSGTTPRVGQHDVDVVVRTGRAGIEQLWVVEGKWWRRSVSKLHVAALASVVQDVVAERGILLSETGFQAGAIRLASLSNITLTSLTELKDGTCPP
jgi:restriction system protein